MRMAKSGLLVGLLCMALGPTASAQDTPWEKYIQAAGKARDHYSNGERYREQGKHELAIKEYKKAIRIEPWYADAHMMLGIAYYCRGSFVLAAKELEDGIKLSGMKPRDAWPFATMQVLSLQRAGMVDEARQRLEEWSRVGGRLEGDAKYLTGEWEEEKYLKRRKQERPHGNLVIGIGSLVKGNLERAKETLQLVIDELSEYPSKRSYRIAEAELKQIESCGQTPCFPGGDAEDENLLVVEEGKPEELYGVRTVYVQVDAAEKEEVEHIVEEQEVIGEGEDWEYTLETTDRHTHTFTRAEDRENILKRLREYKSLTVLDISEGEKPHVVLVFRIRRFPGSRWHPMVENSWGVAFRFKNGHTVRILWMFEDSRTWPEFAPNGWGDITFERAPSTNFARNFIKLLEKVQKRK